MRDSETFGIEKGHGEETITWLNEQAKSQKVKLEARLYGYNYLLRILEILKCFLGLVMFKLQEN